MVSAQLDTPFGDVTVVALHVHWPWPYGQEKQLESLRPALEALEGPVLIGGDFNMVPWSSAIERISAATGTQVIGGLHITKTLFAGVIQLPIDHVLVPEGWRAFAKTGPPLGSDHRSVIATFSPN